MVADVRLHEPIDYEHLRREALAQLESLSSDHWTDYNTHDPGITIMEILCFALTELGLRTNLPIRDLLAAGLDKDTAGFYPSHRILPNQPLTREDYRKLLLNVDQVKNAWLSAIEGHHSPLYLNDTREKLIMMSRLERPYYVRCRHFESKLVRDADPQAVSALNEHLQTMFTDKHILLTRVDWDSLFDQHPVLRRLLLFLEDDTKITLRRNRRVTFNRDNPRREIRTFYGGHSPVGYDLHFLRTVGDEERGRVERLVDALNVTKLDLLAYDFHGLFERCPLLSDVTYRFASTHTVDGVEQADFLRVFKDVNGALCFASHDEEEVVCRGYYRVDVELEEGFLRSRVPQKLEEIRAVLDRHRNLCEFFPLVDVVRDEYVCVCFDIEVSPNADVETVLSEAVYRLDRFISPDIHFYSLAQIKARRHPDTGEPYRIEEIFNGPLLSSGFIDDAELRAAKPKTELRASDVIRELMDVPRVVAVNKILMSAFHPDDRGRLVPVVENQEWVLPLDPTRSSKLLIHYRHGDFQYQSKFTAHKGNLPYTVYAERLYNNVKVLRAGHSPVPFAATDLQEEMPKGQTFDVGAYDSIRNHFPMNYALKEGELADSAPAERKAHVMQLRAFLLFFDQMLANAHRQLAKVGDLLSFHPLDHTYGTQLSETAEALKALLSLSPEEYLARVQSLTESPQTFDQRRNRILDHLLARFGEEFKDYYALAEHMYGDAAHDHLIEDKERILRHLVPWSSQRARAEDLSWSEATPLNVSGLEYRIRLFLGMAVREHQGRDSGVMLNQSHLSLSDDAGRIRFALSNAQGTLLESQAFADTGVRDRVVRAFLGHCEACWRTIERGVANASKAIWEANQDGGLDMNQRIERVEAILLAEPAFIHLNANRRGEVVGVLLRIAQNSQVPPMQRQMTLTTFLHRVEKEPGRDGVFNDRLAKCSAEDGPTFQTEVIQVAGRWTFRVTLEGWQDMAMVLHSPCRFRTEDDARIGLADVANFLLTFHFIDKMFLFEHSLLLLDNSEPDQVLPICKDAEGEALDAVDPYSFRLTLVLPGETELLSNMKFRLYLEKAIRAATPSHLVPKICWVSHEELVAFESAYHTWRKAQGERSHDEATTRLSQARDTLIRTLMDLRSVYDQATLGSALCDDDGDDNSSALVLGYTKLGTMEDGESR